MNLLTIPEAMARLRISKSNFYTLVRQGKLAIVKLGRSTRVTEQAIEECIANATRQPA